MGYDYVFQISKDVEYMIDVFEKLRSVLSMFTCSEDYLPCIENGVFCLKKTLDKVPDSMRSVYENLVKLLQFFKLVPSDLLPVVNYVTVYVCDREPSHVIKRSCIETGDTRLSIVTDSSSIITQVLHRDVVNRIYILVEFSIVKYVAKT